MHWKKRVYLENKLAKEGITLMQEKNIILWICSKLSILLHFHRKSVTK